VRNGDGGFWQAQLGPPVRRPALAGDLDVDIAIVGAGYTGLWTAYYLLLADPALRVAVLEAEHAGFGASGRNGGWLSGTATGDRERYARERGRDAAIRLERAAIETLSEVERVCAAEEIEADLVRGGTLHVAQTPAQLERLRDEVRHEREWGGLGEDDLRLLEPDELAARMRVEGALGASFTPHCARVHPAKLVRGLAEAVERQGATIYERTRALQLGNRQVATPHGRVRADWVVCATEGYTARIPGLRRALVPLGSSMIVTEPLPQDAWRAIGWDGCETLLDGAHVYSYSQRTADGRIAIGGRGVPYRFGSRVDRNAECPARTAAQLRRALTALFPVTADAAIEHRWAGVLGLARDWCATVTADRATGNAWAGGYVGNGVSTANLAARTLVDLMLGRESELVSLPWVGHRARAFEPEPLRFLGARSLYLAFRAADRAEARGGAASRLARVAVRIAGR
jgi:glycine/D-amino acid oxidase-like deaminating enzyme